MLVVKNHGVITDCTVSSSTIDSNFDSIGGIAGESNSSIKNCVNKGNISTTTEVTLGGLVGKLRENGVVEKSRNIGAITGLNTVGGLIGESYGKISNSYNHAEINSNSNSTLIGHNSEDSILQNLYLIPVHNAQDAVYGSKQMKILII